MSIGAYESEKVAHQTVLVNVEIFVPYKWSPSRSDQLGDVVDYEFMRQTVTDHATRGHVQLQERFCDDLLESLLSHPRVRAARVTTEKLDAYPDCRSVGCEAFGIKETI